MFFFLKKSQPSVLSLFGEMVQLLMALLLMLRNVAVALLSNQRHEMTSHLTILCRLKQPK